MIARPSPPPIVSPSTSFRVEVKKLVDRYLGIPLQLLLHALALGCAPFRPERPLTSVRRVLLVKLWGVGNLAMILPYVRALRSQYPEAEIEFWTLERNRAMVETDPQVDRVWTIRDQGMFAPVFDLLRLAFRLRRRRIDLFLDFEQFLRVTGIVGRVAGASQCIGFDTPSQHRARLYHARVPYDDERHMADVFGDIVRSAGVKLQGLPAFAVPRVPEAETRVRSLLGEPPRPWWLLHPGSGDNFPGRRWPWQRFAETGRELQRRHGGTLWISGSESERPLTAMLADSIGDNVRDLTGALDLPELVAALEAMDLVISNDTGPVHLASAVGTAVVALYGPNTPRLYGPLTPNSRALYHRLPCSPCLSNLSGKTSNCRLPACILAIEVDEVVRAAEELITAERARLPSGSFFVHRSRPGESER